MPPQAGRPVSNTDLQTGGTTPVNEVGSNEWRQRTRGNLELDMGGQELGAATTFQTLAQRRHNPHSWQAKPKAREEMHGCRHVPPSKMVG